MNYSLVLQDEAIADISASYSWYEEQLPGLGEDFLIEIEHSFQAVSQGPQYYGYINERFRSIKLNKFPFRIIFELDHENKKTIIIAVKHFHRNKYP